MGEPLARFPGSTGKLRCEGMEQPIGAPGDHSKLVNICLSVN